MEFGLLGPLRVAEGENALTISAPGQRVLLAALLLNAGRVVTADELADMVWDEQPPENARGALHNAVRRLRATLGSTADDLIRTRPPGYVCDIGAHELDVRRFELLVEQGGAATRNEQWPRAASTLREALRLWRGPALSDVPAQALHDAYGTALEEQRLRALVARIEADLHLGRHDEIVPELAGLVVRHPLRERFHELLMLALYRCGRQADALAAYHHARRVLGDELGITPGPALRELHQRMLTGDPTLAPAGVGAGSSLVEPMDVERASARHVPRQLPAPVRHFTGRAVELKMLTTLLDDATADGGTVVISAIGGTAGVGKTALAVQWAHRVAQRFPDGQLYVNLRGFDPGAGPVTPSEAIRGFLDAFGVPPSHVPSTLEAQAARYRSLVAERRLLIILDNARDADQVRPLLPGTSACLVLVTSRNQLLSLVAAEGARLLSLDTLSPVEARDLMVRRLGPETVAREPRATDQLIELCARLPLALNIAAALAEAHPDRPLADLVMRLRDRTGRLDTLHAGDATTNVRAVFSWSYQQLTDDAARLFRLIGLHPGPDVSAAAAASMAGAPLPSTLRALGELTATHLLTEHLPGRYVLHDLLRSYAAEQAQEHDTADSRHEATQRLLDHYLHTAYAAGRLLHPGWPPLALSPPLAGASPEPLADHDQALAWCKAEEPALLAATSHAVGSGFDAHAWQIPRALAMFCFQGAYQREWARTQWVALDAAERARDLVGQAHAYHHLGGASLFSGAYAESRQNFLRALELFERLGEPANQGVVHWSLAGVYNRRQQPEQALEHARRALELYRVSGHAPGLAVVLSRMGWSHALLGDHRQALSYCERALGPLHRMGDLYNEANTLDAIGYAHHKLGHHAEAVTHYERALTLFQKLGERYTQAECLTHLGDTHEATGDIDAARVAWRRALAILADIDHPDTTAVRARLQGTVDGG